MVIAERRDGLPQEQNLPKSPLVQLLEEEIKKRGPIPFARYMQVCLYGGFDKDDSYIPGFYTGGVVQIGDEDGRIPENSVDFITPPEISPMFGFLIGKQIAEIWEKMERPSNFKVVEMGAGNGTLAHDIYYGLRHYKPELIKDMEYIIVEQSKALIAKQQKRLEECQGLKVSFIEASAYESLPKNVTGVFLSCELVDAFPVHIVRKTGSMWEELFIDEWGDRLTRDEFFEKITTGGGMIEDVFREIWKKPSGEVLRFLNEFNPEIEEGKGYPVNIQVSRWMQEVADSLKRGYVITVDYGCSPVKRPIFSYAAPEKGIIGFGEYACLIKRFAGKVDLTSGVDFQALVDSGKKHGLAVEGFVTLGGFLLGLGIREVKSMFMRSSGGLTGDRHIHPITIERLIRENSWSVLIQSKGMEGADIISGVEFLFYDTVSDEERRKFRPVRF